MTSATRSIDHPDSPVLSCNLTAILAATRLRYEELINRLGAAIRDRSETAGGYNFTLNTNTITLPEAAECISMERLCCPFLTLQISASVNQNHWLLSLTGPEGVKPLIQAEIPRR